MSSKHVEVTHHTADVANYVSEHARLNEHADHDNQSLSGCSGVKISIADGTSCRNYPIEGIDVLLRDTRVLQILQVQPTDAFIGLVLSHTI